MLNKPWLIVAATLAFSTVALGQNTNSSTTARPRSTNPSPSPSASKASGTQKPGPTPAVARPAQIKPKVAVSEGPGEGSVVATFNALLDGIRHRDINAVTGVYWNSPGLILFNNNGTVTRGWEQMRKNRQTSYPELKDVKLDVHDVSVIMLGRDGAVVSCLWTQTQTYKGEPETASGRMTLVFKRTGKDWKAVHLHTSPDKPDPTRVAPSEQVSPTPSPTPSQ
jgi:ketosteroid isomerase-like protein